MAIKEGLGVTVLGIGTVFVTMICLAFVFELISKLVNFKKGNKAESQLVVEKIGKNDEVSAEVVAAIMAAISSYEEGNNKIIRRIDHDEARWSQSGLYLTRALDKD